MGLTPSSRSFFAAIAAYPLKMVAKSPGGENSRLHHTAAVQVNAWLDRYKKGAIVRRFPDCIVSKGRETARAAKPVRHRCVAVGPRVAGGLLGRRGPGRARPLAAAAG